MKVLIIQPKIGMGDMIIYLPYIHAISKSYNKPVSVLAKDNSRASELLAEDSHIDEIILLDRNKDKSGTHDGFKGFFNLVEKIKSKKFDKVFIFSSSLRYFLVSKLARIKNISQYPLFKKKDNIVTSAKIFTENELNSIVSTQPNLIISNYKIKELKKKFLQITNIFAWEFRQVGQLKDGMFKIISIFVKVLIKLCLLNFI